MYSTLSALLGLTLTIGGSGGTDSAAGHRRRGGAPCDALSNAQALIFVALVAVMVVLGLLA